MHVKNPPAPGSIQPYYSAIFSCGGWPRIVFSLPNKRNHRDPGNIIDMLEYCSAPIMTGFSYHNGNSITTIVKHSLDLYHFGTLQFQTIVSPWLMATMLPNSMVTFVMKTFSCWVTAVA